jgi:hypothetical protein
MKNYCAVLTGTKTDMSPILTTNIILTKKQHYLDHQFYWKSYTSRLLEDKTKIEANKPSLKVAVQIKWKSILRNKYFWQKNIQYFC